MNTIPLDFTTSDESWQAAFAYTEEHAGEFATTPRRFELPVSPETQWRIEEYNASLMERVSRLIDPGL